MQTEEQNPVTKIQDELKITKPVIKADDVAFEIVRQTKYKKPVTTLCVAITGCTGLLGRNLLFEIIKQNLSNLDNLQLILLGRPKKNIKFSDRIKNILLKDGLFYLKKEYDKKLAEKILARIFFIEFDFEKQSSIDFSNILRLQEFSFDYFFHLGAVSDFRLSLATRKKLINSNIEGTKRIINLIDRLTVKEFIYTGTAYSFGTTEGIIKPDSVNLDMNFRNYYEETKLIAEDYVRKYAKKKNVKIKIFRPVGICGRLIEPPIGSICKYDLFYSWAAFFFRLKLKYIPNLEEIFTKECELDIRIQCNKKGALTLIPADYASKLIWAICMNKESGESHHLTSDFTINNEIYLKLILEELNIQGIKFLEEKPENLSKLEELYYKTIGNVYSDYLMMDSIKFEDINPQQIKSKFKIKSLRNKKENFRVLLKYAKKHYFGFKNLNIDLKERQI
jgi:nucleoside-diphosphate-sugar epimerase